VPFAEKQVTYDYDPNAWWQIKATPVLPFEGISIVTIFVVPLPGAATNGAEVYSINNTTERGISWNDSLIVSSNSGALPLAMKNELPISPP